MGRRARCSAGRSTAFSSHRSRGADGDGADDGATVSFSPSADFLPRHSEGRNPFTYRGPNAGANAAQRLHQEFKSLSKEERQRIVEEEAAVTDLLARTVHLRFLPTGMLQSELAALCEECGEFLRVRICGNSTNTQNWIYGFVEFAERRGADELMRRNGKELSNGPGKPPLRLKCNAAKQAIVDRVFHDADPATNNPCIFGAGNFAHRTLKEAVDSYHNLKKKEGGLLGGKSPNTLKFMHGPSGPLKSDGASLPNDSSNNTNNTNSSSNNKTVDGALSPFAQPYGDAAASDLHGCFTTSVPACHGVHSFPATDDPSEEESPGTTPPMHVSGANGGAIAASDAGTPSLYAQFSATDAASCDWRLHFPTPVSLPHATTTFSPSGALVPHESYLFARARSLVESAMLSAQRYVFTQQSFYEAVGALRTLLAVLEQHAAATGGAASAETETEAAALPQRATELRLLAHLLLALLYGMKSYTEDALTAVHDIVTACNAIPRAKLAENAGQRNEAPAERHSEPCPYVGANAERMADSLQAEDDRSMREDEMCNPIGQGMDLLTEINMGDSDLEDPYATMLSAALSVLPRDDSEDSLSDKGKEQFLLRDRKFHSFVLNVLLSVGLSMESSHPVVSRCVYGLASQRGKDILGVSFPELEQALVSGDVHSFSSALFPQLSGVNNQFDFARVFFETYTRGSPESFWNNLPPLHMVHCFPQSINSRISTI